MLIALSVMPKNLTSNHFVPSVIIPCTAEAYVASVNTLMLVLAKTHLFLHVSKSVSQA